MKKQLPFLSYWAYTADYALPGYSLCQYSRKTSPLTTFHTLFNDMKLMFRTVTPSTCLLLSECCTPGEEAKV
ncbi:hypothetical protein [Xanthocytophaga flava]|uniref:hypothetical protein n=1 Tax=Xanthocytophaga flava TaxID=3048013 RepID=UPI0028D4C3BE|nr:hypothetical protein [Xanthocytophaga flavus]MDJ1473330.1 hypothetical protein [Xanthocytophaga flavus]